MIRRFRDAIVQGFRRAAVPLVAYYTVTLVVPLANGAARDGSGFGEHAAAVLVVPCVLIVLGCALRSITPAASPAAQFASPTSMAGSFYAVRSPMPSDQLKCSRRLCGQTGVWHVSTSIFLPCSSTGNHSHG